MRKLMLAGLLALGSWGVVSTSSATAEPELVVDCSIVLCAQCPPGTVPAPTPGNCCRCVIPK